MGQEGVVPGDEVGKGGQARVVGRGSGRVEGEEREVGVEGGDGVNELDEAEAERVEVGGGCCCCWCAWCCLRVRAVAAVRVERRESRLHADDWLGAGVRFEEVARVRVLELVGVLDGALVERRARDGVRGSERGTTTRPTTARSLSARPAGTKTSTSTPVPARDTPTTRPAAPQPSHLSTSPFSTSSPSPSTPASAPSARAPAATVAPSKPLKPHRRPLQAGCDALHAVGDRGSASRPRPLPSAARHAHVDPPWLQCVPLLPSLVVEELIADS